MAAAMSLSVEPELLPPVEQPRMDLSRLLSTRASSIAYAWRRELCGNCQDPFQAIGQLDGLIEELVHEIGVALADPGELPSAPWGRVSGVLRLSLTRGPDGLGQEFAVLRVLLDQVAAQVGAAEFERRRLRSHLEAVQAQALALLRHRVLPSIPKPGVAFGGVVLEVG